MELDCAELFASGGASSWAPAPAGGWAGKSVGSPLHSPPRLWLTDEFS